MSPISPGTRAAKRGRCPLEPPNCVSYSDILLSALVFALGRCPEGLQASWQEVNPSRAVKVYQWQDRALLLFRGEKIGARCYGDSGKAVEVGVGGQGA